MARKINGVFSFPKSPQKTDKRTKIAKRREYGRAYRHKLYQSRDALIQLLKLLDAHKEEVPAWLDEFILAQILPIFHSDEGKTLGDYLASFVRKTPAKEVQMVKGIIETIPMDCLGIELPSWCYFIEKSSIKWDDEAIWEHFVKALVPEVGCLMDVYPILKAE
ncbi:MAG: hypothetical protein ACE5OZ_03860 [Candidatus Heimdallarchaeota archaeon]